MPRLVHHRPSSTVRRAVVVAAVLAVAAVGCSDDGAGDPAATSRVPAPGTAHGGATDVTTNPAAVDAGPGIDRFDAPATVPCDGPTAAVTVSWEAPDADLVRFLVDGDDVGVDHPPSGTATVDIPCDEQVHVVLLAAVGADGATSVRSEAVLPEPGG